MIGDVIFIDIFLKLTVNSEEVLLVLLNPGKSFSKSTTSSAGSITSRDSSNCSENIHRATTAVKGSQENKERVHCVLTFLLLKNVTPRTTWIEVEISIFGCESSFLILEMLN